MGLDAGLVGYWKLAGDCRDYSGHGNHGTNHGADLPAKGRDGKPGGAAGFDGRSGRIEVPNSPSLRLGARDFSISVWVHTESELDEVLGDIVSQFDPVSRKGFNFSLMNYAGVTSSQSNWRNVHFGIDNGKVEPGWTDCGRLGEANEVYALAVYRGQLYAIPMYTAGVFRLDGESTWTNCGTPGGLRSMSLGAFNGGLYSTGNGGSTWTRTGQLDTTPDVRYRRAWSMAVYQGRLFAGTLPSGRVYSLEAGKNATYDRELAPGWRHLVAVRGGDRLKLYVDGKLVATSTAFNPADYDLSNDQPLQIGFGAHDYFHGRLSDLRLYKRALTAADVIALHETQCRL